MLSPVSNPDDLVSSLKTPERIEFENTIEGLQEETEEEQCEHNMSMSLSRDHGQLDMEVPYDEEEMDSDDSDLEYVYSLLYSHQRQYYSYILIYSIQKCIVKELK
jgi:hypothetical protein